MCVFEAPINMFLDHVLSIKKANLSLENSHQTMSCCCNFRTVLCRIAARAGVMAARAGTPAARAGNEEFWHFEHC